MRTLRLVQTSEGEHVYRVGITFECEGTPTLSADVHFSFFLSDQVQEELRWYFEDYIHYPFEPAPTIAARVERQMKTIGGDLFRGLFRTNEAAREIWNAVSGKLNDIRVEVSTQAAMTLPWELLYEPDTGSWVAVTSLTFVRTTPTPTAPTAPTAGTYSLASSGSPVRILLVTSRPYGGHDVPFRSVASRVLQSLSAREDLDLVFLRPPTNQNLYAHLAEAHKSGRPYHLVHFDGHGAYVDLQAQTLGAPPTKPRGYVLFESADSYEYVDGTMLGRQLVKTGVPLLVLNACRSAQATRREPKEDDAAGIPRAFASLAQEVVSEGVAGVVAMRYSINIDTAVQFVSALYASLANGGALGEAVTEGRRALCEAPERNVGYALRTLQDWPVPVVYERAPITLFPKQGSGTHPATRPQGHAPSVLRIESTARTLSSAAVPDCVSGRDETVLALDRSLDTSRTVLLYGGAGIGKTVAAREFARWYTLTGGVQEPVLFTSLDEARSVAHVLDAVGQKLQDALAQQGIEWAALTYEDRWRETLQLLRQKPVLWIWDNLEAMDGFPADSSSWSLAERRELGRLMKAVQETAAKFLLTSRRNEHDWLGILPSVSVPPMPMPERVQFARALAQAHVDALPDLTAWWPLLEFSRGNPLLLKTVLDRALEKGLQAREEIEAFVLQLRCGEIGLDDSASSERSQSMHASLDYGFEQSFSEAEHRQLALLHFFQEALNVLVYRTLGLPDVGNLTEFHGMTAEIGTDLLDRAAACGVLTAYGGGLYGVHPGLSWYLKTRFDRYYPSDDASASRAAETAVAFKSRRSAATEAYVAAIAGFAADAVHQIEIGNTEELTGLAFEEQNLLHAWRLARTHGWKELLLSLLQGLQSLYSSSGRWDDWARVVDRSTPEFLDPATGRPLPRHEQWWNVVFHARLRLAWQTRQWEEAERLQEIYLEWARHQAAGAQPLTPATFTQEHRDALRDLAVALQMAGHILKDQGKPECVQPYKEAFELFLRIGDQAGAAITAFCLGNAHLTIDSLFEQGQAHLWYERSLERRPEADQRGHSRCWNGFGNVAFRYYEQAREAGASQGQLDCLFRTAVQFYNHSLALLPQDAPLDQAGMHANLGNVFQATQDIELAVHHYSEAIRLFQELLQGYYAGRVRISMGECLLRAGRNQTHCSTSGPLLMILFVSVRVRWTSRNGHGN